MAGVLGFAAIALLLTLYPLGGSAFNERAEDLLELQQRSRDGVIRLKEDTFERFVRGEEPRGYSVVLFYAAKQVADKPELGMPALRKGFALTAQTYQKVHQGTPEELLVFFADVEFADSPKVFADTGVNAVPHIRRFPSVGDGSAPEDVSCTMLVNLSVASISYLAGICHLALSCHHCFGLPLGCSRIASIPKAEWTRRVSRLR
jgi:hypothetical protein